MIARTAGRRLGSRNRGASALPLHLVFAAALLLASGASAEAASGCNGVPGEWKWFNGVTVTLSPGGAVSATGWASNWGRWRCLDRQAGQIRIDWQRGGWIDTLTLSPDGARLAGANQYGTGVSGTLLRSMAVAPASPQPKRPAPAKSVVRKSAPEPALRGLSSIGGPSEPVSIKRSPSPAR